MKLIKFIFSLTILLAVTLTGNSQYSYNSSNYEILKAEKSESASATANKFSMDQLAKQISQNLNYPEKYEAFAIEGKSIIKVKIDEQGKVKDYLIVESMGEAFDQEISKAMLKVKAIKPIQVNGKAAAYSIMVPIEFTK